MQGTLGSQQADHDFNVLGSELVAEGDVQPGQATALSNLKQQERSPIDSKATCR